MIWRWKSRVSLNLGGVLQPANRPKFFGGFARVDAPACRRTMKNTFKNRLRLRYSLRFLWIAVTLASVLLVWVLLPTYYARRFVAAIQAKNYAAAESLCRDQTDPFPGDWKRHKHFEPKAGLAPISWGGLWNGRRQMFVVISYGDNDGIASCGVECRATRRGIEIGMAVP
jgi:hypothetical protein